MSIKLCLQKQKRVGSFGGKKTQNEIIPLKKDETQLEYLGQKETSQEKLQRVTRENIRVNILYTTFHTIKSP